MGIELGLGFLDRISGAKNGAFLHLEDFADRLNHFFSCVIILMLAGVTMANVYFLRPIACTLPTAPENKFNEFAESVCWVRGTVALRESDQTPTTDEDWERLREKADMSFYQWVPFCLSIQGILFFLPHFAWQTFATHLMGGNLEAILDMAYKANTADDNAKRQKFVESAAYHLFRLGRQHFDYRSSRWAQLQHKMSHISGGSLLIAGKRMGNCISLAYIFVKLLYLTNLFGQLYIIRTFLGYHGNLFSFGQRLIGTLTSRHEWTESEFFPRQTYCPVHVRHLGSKNNVFTAICALPVNMFNEKIYIFLWLWIAVVSIITSISLLLWLIRLSLQNRQNAYIRNYLIISIHSQILDAYQNHSLTCDGCNIDIDDPRIEHFITEFVKSDGFFLLRMIRNNAGDVVTAEILNQWWHMFINYQNARLERENRLELFRSGKEITEKHYGFSDLQDDNSMMAPTAPMSNNPNKSNVNFV
uniref:Innexin n=1 Tax=Trichobilharzia regenti TaxID=157069 RepID=A0AA85JL18_TRIRE|nr:unnamed protein product [Trichobilharzia regenti]